MADRTVRVTLTGNATPYQAAMRQAARSTQQAAQVIAASMARAGARGAAAFAPIQAAAGRSAAQVAARWQIAARAIETRFPRLAAAARAAGARMSTGLSAGSAAVAARWNATAGSVSGRWRVAASVMSRAMVGVRSAAGGAASWVAARWNAAAAATSRAMGSIRLAAVTAGAHMMSMATNGEKALKAMRTASLGLLAAFTAAALAAANFEKAMSQVRAATGESAQGMARLSQAALDAGNSTKYSASQAAEAEAELAKAGISTGDIIGGALKGSLALAASGQMELGDSAVVAAQAMNAFGLAGRDVPHIADVISAGAGKSATNVHDMSMAFRQAALVSNQTGLSLEETVGTLSLFAQNALIGSDAGTSLKTMLQRLTPQSKEAQAAMDQLGFSAYDSQGNFVGLSEMAQRLHVAFGGLTPEARNAAFATIFGSDAVRSATILYQAGASGVDKWTKAVNDSGYAGRVAATMTDNLAGDFERLKSALETGLISSGSSANGALRGMAKTLTGVVNWYNQLSPSVQKGVTALAGIVGVVGLVGSAFLLMLPRIMAIRTELVGLGVTAAGTRTALMSLSKIGIVVGALWAAKVAVDSLGASLKPQPPNATKMSTSLINMATSGRVAGQMAKSFGKDLNGLGDALNRINNPGGLTAFTDWMGNLPLGGGDAASLTEAKDKFKAIDDALKSMVQSGNVTTAKNAFAGLAKEAASSGHSTAELKGVLPGYVDALASSAAEQKATAQSQKGMGDAAAKTKTEFEDQRSAAEKLTDALKTLNGLNISAAEQEISFRQSLADLTSAVRENGHSLDTTSEKGRKVKSAYLDAAKAAQEHAQAVADQKGSVEAGNAVLEQDIAALKRTMHQAGFSASAIRDLTAAYAQLPGAKNTTVRAINAAKTMAELDTIRQKVQNVPAGKSITVKAPSGPAIAALRDIGYKVVSLPNHQVRITVPTGSQKAQIAALQRQIDALRGRIITNTVRTVFERVMRGGGSSQAAKNAAETAWRANGSVDVEHFANGGMRENQIAQIAPAGAWRVWAEPSTGGESYIPLSPSKRTRSRKIAEETVRRLGGKGIAWYANGGVNASAGGGFTYAPTQIANLSGTTDSKRRYDDLISKLKTAWNEYDAAVKALDKVRKGKHTAKQLADAKKKVAAEYADVKAIDKSLGLKGGARAPSTFNLAAYQKQLTSSLAATEKWRTNLAKIGQRGGEEVRSLLEGMGEDGYYLVNSLAGASSKQFADIVAKLKKVGGVAKATLADFTTQLGASTAQGQQFASDLQMLASRGFGDLAQALAAQGDATAATLAHQAATGSAADVSKANAAVKATQSALAGDDLTNSLLVLSALRSKKGAGIADVLGTGIEFSTLRTLVPKILAQINKLPSVYKSAFLAQWAGQSGAAAMARGGILTRPTAVLAAEAGDVESWIPVNGSARSQGLLARTAGLMGYQLIPAGRYGTARDSGGQTVREGDRNTTVNLYGAKQTGAEQARDIARHLAFVG